MHKPDHRLVIALAAFVIGGVCGSIGGGYYGFVLASELTSTMAAQSTYYRSIITVNNTVTALSHVNEGRTSEALKQLDQQLDFALSELVVSRTASANTGCEPGLVKAVSSARAYRAAHPSSMQEPTVKAALQEALGICKKSP